MDTELFELCKEVNKRKPEWRNTGQYWVKDYDGISGWRAIKDGELCGELDDHYAFRVENMDDLVWGETIIPLYTSDYLLEKLKRVRVSVKKNNVGGSWTSYGEGTRSMNDLIETESDTPLKALLKLTIALSDAGELK